MRYKDFKKYKIKSKERFRELYYFTLQYPEWKHQLEEVTFLGSPEISGMPHGSGVGDPTGSLATASAELISKINLIDGCVKDAAPPKFQKGLLKGLTTPNSNYNWLYARGYIKCGSQKYYQMRGMFFWILDQRKG